MAEIGRRHRAGCCLTGSGGIAGQGGATWQVVCHRAVCHRAVCHRAVCCGIGYGGVAQHGVIVSHYG